MRAAHRITSLPGPVPGPAIGRGRAWCLVAAAALALAGCSPFRAIEAAHLLGDIAAGPGPSTLKRQRPPPRRHAIAYRVDGRARTGDLYWPGDRAEAALVLVPGAARAGKDDPRLVALAESLARARFAVLVPEIPRLRALRVSPADARDVADAVRHLAARVGEAGKVGEVGIGAISYAVGPALLAAMTEDARPHVRFVVAIGGYYDIEAVVTFFTTGRYRDRPDRAWRYRRPNAYGKWIFVRSNAGRLDDPADRALLIRMAERRTADLGAPIDDLVRRLGPQGRAVYALIVNRDPQRVGGLIAALPRAVRDDMAALDLKRHGLSRLAARLIVIHGRDDAIIPYTESRALAAAAADADLYLSNSLMHVNIGPGDLFDTIALWRAAYRLLEERDAMPAPARRPAARKRPRAGRPPTPRQKWRLRSSPRRRPNPGSPGHSFAHPRPGGR